MKRWWGIRHLRWLRCYVDYVLFLAIFGRSVWEMIRPQDFEYLKDIWKGNE